MALNNESNNDQNKVGQCGRGGGDRIANAGRRAFPPPPSPLHFGNDGGGCIREKYMSITQGGGRAGPHEWGWVQAGVDLVEILEYIRYVIR